MELYVSHSGSSSAGPGINDLDGYTLRDYTFSLPTSYAPADEDEFGFDPPAAEQKPTIFKIDHTYSPPRQNDPLSLSGWPDFDREAEAKLAMAPTDDLDSYEIDKFISQSLPNATTAISRYGQMTPPRSSSTASSVDNNTRNEDDMSPQTGGAGRRKRTKVPVRDAGRGAPTPTTPGRKRKNNTTRKAAGPPDQANSPEDIKRKQSLEKNRLAAAKCRINKKEKTEQLQRDSHEKAVHNAFLKDQVMRMKEEIQQMNAILLAHANSEGCKSPKEIQKHLTNLGNDFYVHHMSLAGSNFADYPQLLPIPDLPQLGPTQVMADSYYPAPPTVGEDPSLLAPPLPEFDRSAEFEVHTPRPTD